METKYYMSIGYPIGLCQNEEEDKFFNVENKGEFIGLYNDSYLLWKYCFFDIKTKEDIIKHLYKEHKLSDFNANIEICRLKEHGVLIEITSTKISDLYDLLKDLYPVKNGFGHGLIKEGASARVINQGQYFDLTITDFCLWGICNNRRNIKELVEWYKDKYKTTDDQAKCDVINILFRLKTIDLLRISN